MLTQVMEALNFSANIDVGITLDAAEVRELTARLAAAEALAEALEEVEWEHIDADDNPYYDPICPWCDNAKHEGHKPDCVRRAALRQYQEVAK